MKKFLLLSAFLLTACPIMASDQYFETGCSSVTSAGTSLESRVKISSFAYSLDMVSVTNPGTSSFVELWDWRDSTGTGKFLGKYDTTAKHDFPQGLFGVAISTDIVIHNQGNPPAGIKIYFRPKSAGVCRSPY